MNPGSLTIRPARAEDVDRYLALMNLGDFRRKKTAAYFPWFYFESPRKTVLLLAFEGSRLAGQMGLQFREMPGLRAGMIVDMVVAPPFRGKGVFREMEGAAARIALLSGASLLTSFTNPGGERALLRLGSWHVAALITTLECRNSTGPHATARSHEGPSALSFADPVGENEWRFSLHPEYRYRQWGEGGGALWTKDFTDANTGNTVTDLVSAGGGTAIPPEILEQTVRRLRAEGANVFTAWALPGTPDARSLAGLGFRAGEQRRSFCIRWLESEAEARFDGQSWALRQADTEVF